MVEHNLMEQKLIMQAPEKQEEDPKRYPYLFVKSSFNLKILG